MPKTVITNALVFDGYEIHSDRTVIIDNGIIGADATDAQVLDCSGMTLLPGLIDAHVHMFPNHDESSRLLKHMAECGITTALDMGHLPATIRNALHRQAGLADLRFAGSFATSSGSTHSRMGGLPKNHLVDSLEQAVQFVQERINEGANYIKVVADIPGPSQEILNALATEARKQGKITVAHAARNAAFKMAQEAKVDIVTHVPLDKALDEAAAELMAKEQRVSVPTLAVAEMIPKSGRIPGTSYEPARDSVAMLHRFNVPILAGTDSNQSPMAPVPHGEGLHHELELLMGAGLSSLDALRAATSLPAKYFDLEDRGIIEPGKRADLVLVSGNPVENIKATRLVKRVWLNGAEVVVGE